MSSYEYAGLFTDENSEQMLVTDRHGVPFTRADADTFCRIRRTWQVDRRIEPDATLVRRLPGGGWDEDPQWDAGIRAWNEHIARIDQMRAAGDQAGEVEAFRLLNEWHEARVQELMTAGGEIRGISSERPRFPWRTRVTSCWTRTPPSRVARPSTRQR